MKPKSRMGEFDAKTAKTSTLRYDDPRTIKGVHEMYSTEH